MKIDLSDRRLYNDVYLPVIFGNHRYEVLYGGRDSGKSRAVAQKVVYRLLNDRYCKVVCVRKFHRTILDSQIAMIWEVIQSWNLTDLFTMTVAPPGIKCNNNGNSVITRGMDDPEKIKSLTDPTMIWVEEATEVDEDDYITLDTSLRCSHPDIPLTMTLTFNPMDERTWINTTFFQPKATYEKPTGRFLKVPSIKDDCLILHTGYWDNRWCPPERQKVYTSLPEHKRKIFCYGLWGGDIKGKIYTNYSFADQMPGIEDRRKHRFALDFGFSNHPTACVECCLGPGGKVYVEEMFYKTGLMNMRSKNANNIPDELDKCEIDKSFVILCDSAEPKSIQELCEQGYSAVGVKKGPGSIARGIGILQSYEIVICGDSPNLKREISTYAWEQDRNGNLTNKPVGKDDHLCDSLRYYALDQLNKGEKIKAGHVVFG